MSVDQVVYGKLIFPLFAMAMPTAAVLFTIGLVLGRAIARGLVRALLPPRLRGPLAILWTSDGRVVPRRSVT
jgi:hypothetical protein